MAESTYIGPHEIKDAPLWWQLKGLSYTTSGYGRKIPTSKMVRLKTGRQVWRRVYCCIYSNIGTCYIVVNGQWQIVS
jgi:hypothetical protein